MIFIQYVLPLIGSYFTGGTMAAFWFVPVFCLAFLATVPFILIRFFRR